MKLRRYYILIIFLFMGAMFEAFKGIALDANNPSRRSLSAGELKNLDIQPFHLKGDDAVNDKSSSNKNNTKNLKNSFAKNHTFEHGKKKARDKKKKLAEKDKKKKDKKKKTATPDLLADNAITPEDTEEQNNNDDGNPEEPHFFGGIPGPTQANQAEEVPTSTDEWIKILLDYPNYKKLQEFIAHYLNQRISALVFYEVITAMMEDSREEVNIYAIRAAGSTPSYQSFYFLTTAIAEPSLSSMVTSLARTQLETYRNLQYLNTLKSVVITQGYPMAQTLAVRMIAKSAQTNLKKKTNTTTSAPPANEINTDENRNPTVTENVKENYQKTRELLTDILTLEGTDSNLASALNEAIRAIDDLLT